VGCGPGPRLVVRDLATGQERRSEVGLPEEGSAPPRFDGVFRLAWHPDSRRLAYELAFAHAPYVYVLDPGADAGCGALEGLVAVDAATGQRAGLMPLPPDVVAVRLGATGLHAVVVTEGGRVLGRTVGGPSAVLLGEGFTEAVWWGAPRTGRRWALSAHDLDGTGRPRHPGQTGVQREEGPGRDPGGLPTEELRHGHPPRPPAVRGPRPPRRRCPVSAPF
jgi:hypothetical protein